MRGIVGALIILPLAAIILPGGVQFGDIGWFGFVAVMLCGSLAGAAVGLVLGTAVEARQINVVFAVVLTPLLFTGATFYPWAALDWLRWFQVITLLNPLTYVSEGLRAAVTDARAPRQRLDRPGAGRLDAGLRRDRRARLRAARGRLGLVVEAEPVLQRALDAGVERVEAVERERLG